MEARPAAFLVGLDSETEAAGTAADQERRTKSKQPPPQARHGYSHGPYLLASKATCTVVRTGELAMSETFEMRRTGLFFFLSSLPARPRARRSKLASHCACTATCGLGWLYACQAGPPCCWAVSRGGSRACMYSSHFCCRLVASTSVRPPPSVKPLCKHGRGCVYRLHSVCRASSSAVVSCMGFAIWHEASRSGFQ